MSLSKNMQQWIVIAERIFKDLNEPLQYLPQAFLHAFGMTAICFFIPIMRRRKVLTAPKRKDDVERTQWFMIVCIFLTYLFVIIQQVFLSRAPGSRTSVDLIFLSTWGISLSGNAYVIENVILFLPFGILIPLLIKPLQKRGILTVLIACIASVAIETAQYLTQRGHCQLDDVVMNTLGAALGWILIKLYLRFFAAHPS